MKNRIKIISCEEMFPELKDTNNRERFIDFLYTHDMKVFVRKALDKAEYKLTDDDLLLCRIILDKFIYKGVLYPERRAVYIDTLLAAAMLRKCYYNDDKPVTSIFKAREEFNDLEILDEFKHGIPKNDFEQIYQCIESQQGELTEVQFCKPSTGSLQDTFAECVYILECVKKYGN